MTAPMFDQLEQAAAQLREQGERIRTFQTELARRSTTVVSKDRMVSATVNGTGRLTALVLKGNRYRMMSPAELANAVLATVNEALEKASNEALAAANALMPTGFGSGGLDMAGNIDLDEFMKSAMERIDNPLLRFDNDAPTGSA